MFLQKLQELPSCIVEQTFFIKKKENQRTKGNDNEKKTSKRPEGRSATFKVQGLVFFFFLFFFSFDSFDLNSCTISCNFSLKKHVVEPSRGRCVPLGGLFLIFF